MPTPCICSGVVDAQTGNHHLPSSTFDAPWRRTRLGRGPGNLGNALKEQGKRTKRSPAPPGPELKPDYAEAHNNLGIALRDRGSWTKRSPATAGRWN